MTHEEQIAKLTEMLEIQTKLTETTVDMLKPAVDAAYQKGYADDIQAYVKPWVGLTRDEQSFVYSSLHDSISRKDSFWVDFANAIEAKLKEKNT